MGNLNSSLLPIFPNYFFLYFFLSFSHGLFPRLSIVNHDMTRHDKTLWLKNQAKKQTWAFLFQLLMWILIILILILILIVLIVAIAVPMSRRPKRVSPLGGVNTLHVNFFLFFFSLLKQAQSHERQEPARFDYNSSIASKQTGVPLPYSSSSSSSFFPSVALASLFL